MSMIAEEYWRSLSSALQHGDPIVRRFAEQTKSVIQHLGDDLVEDAGIIDELSREIQAVYREHPELGKSYSKH